MNGHPATRPAADHGHDLVRASTADGTRVYRCRFCTFELKVLEGAKRG